MKAVIVRKKEQEPPKPLLEFRNPTGKGANQYNTEFFRKDYIEQAAVNVHRAVIHNRYGDFFRMGLAAFFTRAEHKGGGHQKTDQQNYLFIMI